MIYVLLSLHNRNLESRPKRNCIRRGQEKIIIYMKTQQIYLQQNILHKVCTIKNCEICIEIRELVIRVCIQRSNMSSLLVPVPVVVIRHNIDDIQELVQHRNIVPGINDRLAGAHGGGQEPAPWSHLSAQLTDKLGEGGLV